VLRTPQFWFLWIVLCFNVTAGIGVLGQASAMIQEIFKGRIGSSEAAGFVGLLSLFNMGGRFLWASLSDRIGRKATYACFFTLGPVLYGLAPLTGKMGSVSLFVACFSVILTMYGGGFATIPAYLADVFGVKYVSAVHGRLLTAWSAAGVLGPVLVNYIRQFQIDRGIPAYQAYNVTMYIMAALLVVAFAANLAVRPVAAKHVEKVVEPPATPAGGGPRPATARGRAAAAVPAPPPAPAATGALVLVPAWLAVGIPMVWGVAQTIRKALALFD
jgi:MFS family permease